MPTTVIVVALAALLAYAGSVQHNLFYGQKTQEPRTENRAVTFASILKGCVISVFWCLYMLIEGTRAVAAYFRPPEGLFCPLV